MDQIRKGNGARGVGMRFAHWVPNVSGGLVVSKVPQRTDWTLEYNVELLRIAERAGFEYALTQIRLMGSYGADCQHDSTLFSAALLGATRRIKVITAVLPGIFHPIVVAKQGATADQIFDGRWAVNVASGWYRREYDALGVEWPEHDERYVRSREFIEIMRGAWTTDRFGFEGKYWTIKGFTLSPKPLVLPGRPVPEVFQGGNSDAAQENAAAVSDWYLMNGNRLDALEAQIRKVRAKAARYGRSGAVRFGVNAFVIVRETEEAALAEHDRIVGSADEVAVGRFRLAVMEAGAATADRQGMWVDSTKEDLVQYNDGFRTGLIGTAEQVAARIHRLHRIGVDLVLCAFLHFQEETRAFGETVVPKVRDLEARERARTPEPA